MLDAGTERVLRAVGKDPNCAPEAYGALRDLGIEALYVKVLDNGSVVAAYEAFGESKPRFNPVYDDRPDMEDRVDREAEAPFKESSMLHDHSSCESGDCGR